MSKNVKKLIQRAPNTTLELYSLEQQLRDTDWSIKNVFHNSCISLINTRSEFFPHVLLCLTRGGRTDFP